MTRKEVILKAINKQINWIQAADILGVPVRFAMAKTYWATGGGIGVAVGGLGGALATMPVCSSTGGDDPENWCGLMISVGVVGGGAIGFGLGALIGSAFKKKEPVVQTIIDPATGMYGASVGMSF